MNARNLFIVKGVIGLVILWAVVFGIVKLAGSKKPNPEKIQKYAENNPLSEIEDSDKRREVIGKVAVMLNQLNPDQFRQFVGKSDEGRDRQDRFFAEMTPDEQLFFMEKRIGRAFNQMMTAFNEMDRDQRKGIIENSLKQMKNNPNGGPGRKRMDEIDPEMAEKITKAGLKAYFEDASAETKLDIAPLLEEMQKSMGAFRGARKR